MYQPLADRIRPKTLDEVVGQRHILGENGLLRRVIESGQDPQHGVLRPLRHGQDHGGQHHRRPFRANPAAAQRHHRRPV